MSPEQHVVTSLDGEYSRNVWLVRGPKDAPPGLAVFLDAEHYLRDMNVLPVLEEVCQQGLIPPLTYVFVSHVSGAARHEDYTCNPQYANFIVEDVVRWAGEQVAGLPPTGELLCGLSLSGLQAAYLALTFPYAFTRILAQSGSFWWKREWLSSFAQALPPKVRRKYWISVGDQETTVGERHPPTGLHQEISQIDAAFNFARTLRARGDIVHQHLFPGGHAIQPWRDELPQALAWLFDEKSTAC